jgi:hypothetical protein
MAKVAYTSVSMEGRDEERVVEAVVLSDEAPPQLLATTADVKEFVEVQAPVTMVGGYELTVVVDGSHWVVVVVRFLSVHCEKFVRLK